MDKNGMLDLVVKAFDSIPEGTITSIGISREKCFMMAETSDGRKFKLQIFEDRKSGGGFCNCGCGGQTKGGAFIPGHDAIMKSELLTRLKQGDSAQRAEVKAIMESFGWYTDKVIESLEKYDTKVAEKAQREADKIAKAASKAAAPAQNTHALAKAKEEPKDGLYEPTEDKPPKRNRKK